MTRGDRWLLVLPLLLTAVGVIMVYSSSAILGLTRYQDPNYFLSRQLFRAGLGVAVLLLTAKLDLRRVEAAAPAVIAAGVALLTRAVAAGHISHGASRWLRVGFLTLQPTDAGRIAELAETTTLFAHPKHPYTAALLAALPARQSRGQPLTAIPGAPPDLATPPLGCRFHPRCPYTEQACIDAIPPLEVIEGEHTTACRRHELLP